MRTVGSYIDAFAPVIIKAHRPARWPEAIAIDSLPLRKRRFRHGQPQSVNAGEVMVAIDHSASPTRPILSRILGGKDGESWADFLASLPEAPRWVVADKDWGIEWAVEQAWPNAILYNCDEHLRRNARTKALEDGIPKWRKTADAPPDLVIVQQEEEDDRHWPPVRRRYHELHPVWGAVLTCLISPEHWEKFKAIVEDEVPAHKMALRTWIADNEALVLHQCDLRLRYPTMPTSTGQAETFLEIVRRAFAGRAGCGFRSKPITRFAPIRSTVSEFSITPR